MFFIIFILQTCLIKNYLYCQEFNFSQVESFHSQLTIYDHTNLLQSDDRHIVSTSENNIESVIENSRRGSYIAFCVCFLIGLFVLLLEMKKWTENTNKPKTINEYAFNENKKHVISARKSHENMFEHILEKFKELLHIFELDRHAQHNAKHMYASTAASESENKTFADILHDALLYIIKFFKSINKKAIKLISSIIKNTIIIEV